MSDMGGMFNPKSRSSAMTQWWDEAAWWMRKIAVELTQGDPHMGLRGQS
jgi:hypothetical protein